VPTVIARRAEPPRLLPHEDLRESLDHVLVSEQVYDNSRNRRWSFDGLVTNNDHLTFDNHKGVGTGDHGVVMVSFKHDPA
jgi:hypothetical protein